MKMVSNHCRHQESYDFQIFQSRYTECLVDIRFFKSYYKAYVTTHSISYKSTRIQHSPKLADNYM